MVESNGDREEGDLTLEIQKQSVRVAGWYSRHKGHSEIAAQVKLCDGSHFQLLFRGVKEIPHGPEALFVLGLKARPMYLAGEPERLSWYSRQVATDETQFRVLAQEFTTSPMMTRNQQLCSVDVLLKEYHSSGEGRRIRLAQLLLYGMQYQVSDKKVNKWKDRLFILSSTTTPDVAVRYALAHDREGPFPTTALVIEYAPPCAGHCFEPMSAIMQEFAQLHVGEWSPDRAARDAEMLIPFGLLPHYVLGYVKLNCEEPSGDRVVYRVSYVPNPAFAVEGYSIDNPKNLTEEQEKKRKELNGKVAWAYHQWTGETGEWFQLRGPQGKQDISGAAADRS